MWTQSHLALSGGLPLQPCAEKLRKTFCEGKKGVVARVARTSHTCLISGRMKRLFFKKTPQPHRPLLPYQYERVSTGISTCKRHARTTRLANGFRLLRDASTWSFGWSCVERSNARKAINTQTVLTTNTHLNSDLDDVFAFADWDKRPIHGQVCGVNKLSRQNAIPQVKHLFWDSGDAHVKTNLLESNEFFFLTSPQRTVSKHTRLSTWAVSITYRNEWHSIVFRESPTSAHEMLLETSSEQLDARSFVAPLSPMLLGSSTGLCVYGSSRPEAAAQPTSFTISGKTHFISIAFCREKMADAKLVLQREFRDPDTVDKRL